jgi:hypothetical protein
MGSQFMRHLGQETQATPDIRHSLPGDSLSPSHETQIEDMFRHAFEAQDADLSQGEVARRRTSMPPRRPLNVEPRSNRGEME